MRNYWLRILIGAVAIFSVGMVGVTLARQGVHRVRGVVEGSGPITVPVAFVPFKLDGEKIGTIRRIKINRLAPKTVSSVNILVDLADSVRWSRLEPCILVAEGFERLNSETTVTCGAPDDTVGEDLAVVGDITVARGGHSFKLLMPRDAIRELTDSEVVFVGEDSASTASRGRDSIAEAAERMTDSILEAKRPALESLGVNIPRRTNGARKPNHRVADSVRSR
ncbi:MAG: hypothetical protein ACJ8BF_04455 [Gemmatimonadales bacterium]